MKVIIINGPMCVGKTAVGKYIADHHPGTALIDGDWCIDIHPFVGNARHKRICLNAVFLRSPDVISGIEKAAANNHDNDQRERIYLHRFSSVLWLFSQSR